MIRIITRCRKYTSNCDKFEALAHKLAGEYDFENLYFLGVPIKEIKRYNKSYLLMGSFSNQTASYPLERYIAYLLPKPKYKHIVCILSDLYNPTVLFVTVDYLIATGSGIKVILTQKTKDPKAFVEKMFEVFGYDDAVCTSRSTYSKSFVYLPNHYFTYDKQKTLKDKEAFRDYLLEKIKFIKELK